MDTSRTPTAEDEAVTVDSEKDHSESSGPEAEAENDGISGSVRVPVEDPDSPTPDSTSLGTDGPETRKWTCEKKNILTSTALVKKDDTDKTRGSGSGVDDHAIKLPLLLESAVRAKVYSVRHECSTGSVIFENDTAETCGTKTDKIVCCARANGEEK